MSVKDTRTHHDAAFIDAIVPHEQLAVVLAEVEVTHGLRVSVMKLAQRVKDSHLGEVKALKRARAEIGSARPLRHQPIGEGNSELLTLESARGAEVDHLFLDEMIAHNEASLAMARAELTKIEDPNLKALTVRIIEEEQREVNQLRAMLEAVERETR